MFEDKSLRIREATAEWSEDSNRLQEPSDSRLKYGHETPRTRNQGLLCWLGSAAIYPTQPNQIENKSNEWFFPECLVLNVYVCLRRCNI
jgi:hypothetical protein